MTMRYWVGWRREGFLAALCLVFGILGIGIGFYSVNLGFRGTFVVYIGIE
jgi:hypothetical protein